MNPSIFAVSARWGGGTASSGAGHSTGVSSDRVGSDGHAPGKEGKKTGGLDTEKFERQVSMATFRNLDT